MATTSLFPFSPSQKQDAATVAASIVRECIDATATLVAIALAVGSLALTRHSDSFKTPDPSRGPARSEPSLRSLGALSAPSTSALSDAVTIDS
jgi:hypothetical protein